MKRLSRRQLEVMELFAKGSSIKEVSSQLFIAESTVKNTAQDIYDKLNLKRSLNCLTAWYYITKYNLEVDGSVLKNNVITYSIILLIFNLSVDFTDIQKMRGRRLNKCYKREYELVA